MRYTIDLEWRRGIARISKRDHRIRKSRRHLPDPFHRALRRESNHRGRRRARKTWRDQDGNEHANRQKKWKCARKTTRKIAPRVKSRLQIFDWSSSPPAIVKRQNELGASHSQASSRQPHPPRYIRDASA